VNRLIVIIFLISIGACNSKPKSDTLTGDLYFSFFRLGSYYNQPDSIIEGCENYFDTLKYETADQEQRRFFNQYKRLKEENLLYQPFVDLLTEEDSVVTLYLETTDYNEIKRYKRKELQDEGKKIRIQADVRRIGAGLYYCLALTKVEKVDGETGIRSRKWKVQDYE
jgi:hypothetical protein